MSGTRGGPARAGGRLLVCATPIGNLDDVTLRVLAALRDADVVACEDTRHTRGLLDRHGIAARALLSYHEHNERARSEELVRRIAGGEVVALVSDAGMPSVSDPGWVLIDACWAAGQRVEVLPGPSAAVTALVVSGLPAERWRFVGFLPRRGGALADSFTAEETTVAYESPRRVGASLAALAAVDAERPVAVCRELTKLHEEVVRGTAGALAARYQEEAVRGEVVLVIGAAPPGVTGVAVGRAAVGRLVASGARRREAAKVVAELTGGSANELYEGEARG